MPAGVREMAAKARYVTYVRRPVVTPVRSIDNKDQSDTASSRTNVAVTQQLTTRRHRHLQHALFRCPPSSDFISKFHAFSRIFASIAFKKFLCG